MSESVQWTLLTPLVLTVVLGIIQLGLWGYGRTVALNAAGAGAEEAAPVTATQSQAEAAALNIAQHGGLTDVDIQVGVSGAEVVARVTGRVPGLIDVGITSITAQVTRAKEQVS
jgi:TadE-like protein